MATTTLIKVPARTQGKKRITPATTGTPDPRPLTDFTVAVSTVSGHTRVTRHAAPGRASSGTPRGAFVACDTGAKSFAASVTVGQQHLVLLRLCGHAQHRRQLHRAPQPGHAGAELLGGFVRPRGQVVPDAGAAVGESAGKSPAPLDKTTTRTQAPMAGPVFIGPSRVGVG